MSGGWPHKRGGKAGETQGEKEGEKCCQYTPANQPLFKSWARLHESGTESKVSCSVPGKRKNPTSLEQSSGHKSTLHLKAVDLQCVCDLIIRARRESERDQAWWTKQTGLKNREAIVWSPSASVDGGDLFCRSSKEITNYTLKLFVNIQSALSD